MTRKWRFGPVDCRSAWRAALAASGNPIRFLQEARRHAGTNSARALETLARPKKRVAPGRRVGDARENTKARG